MKNGKAHVIAGSHQEFLDYVNANGRNPNDFVFVASGDQMRGCRGVSILLVGNYTASPVYKDPAIWPAALECVVADEDAMNDESVQVVCRGCGTIWEALPDDPAPRCPWCALEAATMNAIAPVWVAVNTMTDAPDHDCLVAFVHADQKPPGQRLSDPGNLGASVGWLSWSPDRSFWTILEDGEVVMASDVTALCELPTPDGITAGTGARP